MSRKISTHQLRGTVLVALSGTLFGLMGYLGTQILNYQFSIANMLFWRFLLASFFIFVSLFYAKKRLVKPSSSLALIKIILFGAISYSGGSVFYFMASEYTGTGVAMVIFFSFPIFVTLFAWFLGGWRMNLIALCSLLAVIMGLLCLKGAGSESLNLTGLLLGMLAAFSYAVYVYGSQFNIKSIDSRLLTFLVCFGNTILFLIVSVYTNTFVVPSSFSLWLYICALSLLATVLPIQFMLDGLKYISPIKASILSVLEPVVTVLIGIILLGESISTIQSIGIIIVLLGAILIQFETNLKESL